MAYKNRRTIILGAGLAGLSAAYHTGYPIYEECKRPGGTAASLNKEDFVFDIGIHLVQSKNKYFLNLLRKLNVQVVTHKRNGWIYSFGNYSLYPFQVNTSHLPLFLRLKCITDFLIRRSSKKPTNYKEWALKNFGHGFANTFLIPYAEKFWRTSPKKLTFEWAKSRVPRPKLIDVFKGAFKDQDTELGLHLIFQYPSEKAMGFAAIAEALAKHIKEIHYSMKITSIDPITKTATFNFGEHKVCYNRIISTIALPELIKLLPDIPPSVSESAKKLDFNSIAIVNLGVNRANLGEKHWVHFPEKDISFFRISIPSNFCEGLAPPGTSSIQAEVSYDRKNPPDRDKLLKQVRNDLIKVGILQQEDKIIFQDVLYKRYAYVIYTHDRKEAVRRIHNYLHDLEIYPSGRYGAWEYLWSDEAILSGKIVGEKVLHKL